MNAAQPVIVVGVDGSDASKEALLWAARQAELTGSALVAVTSWQFPAMRFWTGMMAVPDDYDFPGVTQKNLDHAIGETLGDHPTVEVSTVVVGGPQLSSFSKPPRTRTCWSSAAAGTERSPGCFSARSANTVSPTRSVPWW